MTSRRLLLVEDEESLARLLSEYLRRLGYAVDSCRSAQCALDLLQSDPAGYALVIADLTLPDMSGDRLLDGIRRRCPDTPVLVASGYPDAGGLCCDSEPARFRFLQKPFLPQTLAETVAAMLPLP